MTTPDSDMVERLLKQSILTVCKEVTLFDRQLEVDGIICLTRDGGTQQVIKVHELFQTIGDDNANAAMQGRRDSAVEIRQTTQKPKVQRIHTASPGLSNNLNTESSEIKSEVDVNVTAADNTNNNIVKSEAYPAVKTEAEAKSTATENTNNNIVTSEAYPAVKTEAEVKATATENTNNNSVKSDVRPEIRATTSVTPAPAVETAGEMETDTIDARSNDDANVNPTPDIVKIELNVKQEEDKSLSQKLDEKHGIDRSLPASTERNIPCRTCDIFLDNGPAFENHNLIQHREFTCYVCLKTFTNRTNMRRHLRLHTGIKPFKCPECPETFFRQGDVKRHLLRHNFEKPFRCVICKIGYSDRSYMRNHMQKIHAAGTVHICSKCGESYINFKAFQVHKKSHPEFREFSCKQCDFVGSNALMINKHMLTHGPRKTYRCPNCTIILSNPFAFTEHLKSHKADISICDAQYPCCFCDVVLSTFDQFQRHEHVHNQTKIQTCGICQKQFSRLSSLKEHMISHNTATPMSTGTHGVATTVDGKQTNDAVTEDTSEQMSAGPSDYWCTECQHGFGSEIQLQIHIEDTHEGKPDIGPRDDGRVPVSFRVPTTAGNDFKTPTSVSTGKTGQCSEGETTHEDNPLRGMLNKLKNKIKSPTTTTNYVYDELTQLDDFTANGQNASGHTSVYDEATQDYTNMNTISERRWQLYRVPRPRPNIGETTQNVGAGKKTTSARGATTGGGMASPTNPSSRSPLTKTGRYKSKGADQNISSNNEDTNKKYSGMDIKEGATPMSESNVTTPKRPKLEENGTFVKVEMGQDHNENNVSFDMESPAQYSPTSVLGMDTEFTSAENLSSNNVNATARSAGCEQVVTPDLLFKSNSTFSCDLCDAKFNDFDHFNVHNDLVHHNYVCEYCGKTFTSRANRERHGRYHTGTKPYKCGVCGDTFFRGDDLKYHTTTKHAFKPFSCATCRKSFAFTKQLDKHFVAYPEHRDGH